MAFLSIYADGVQPFVSTDYAFIYLLGLCIFFGFGSTLMVSDVAFIACLCSAVLCYFAAAYICTIIVWKKGSKKGKEESSRKLSIIARDTKLENLLIGVMPPFPIVYILGVMGVISLDTAYVALMVSNVVSKCIFLNAVCDLQSKLIESLSKKLQESETSALAQQLEAEKRATQFRRSNSCIAV